MGVTILKPCLFLTLSVCFLAVPTAQAQFTTGGVINAAGTPKGTVFLTFDDGLDETGPDGQSQIEKIGHYLHGPIDFAASEKLLHPLDSSTNLKKAFERLSP